jgi:hypothetical protein
MKFSPLPCYQFSTTLSLRCSLNVSDKVSRPYTCNVISDRKIFAPTSTSRVRRRYESLFWCKVSVTFNRFKPKLKHVLKNSKFRENTLSGSRVFPCKATDKAILIDTP